MKIEKYEYGRSYLLPNGDWDKYAITVSLDDTDNPDNARELTKLMVDDFFCRNNPGIKPIQVIDANGELPVIQVTKQKPEDRAVGLFAKDIESCTDLTVLDSYKLLIKDNLLLQSIYDKRRREIVEFEKKNILNPANQLTQKK